MKTENILDQIFFAIDFQGNLREGVLLSDIYANGLHPYADKIISNCLWNKGQCYIFSKEDFFILISEASTAKEETLIEMAMAYSDMVYGYCEAFYPFLKLKIEGKIDDISFENSSWAGENSWGEEYYSRGRVDLCSTTWLLYREKFDEVATRHLSHSFWENPKHHPKLYKFFKWAHDHNKQTKIYAIWSRDNIIGIYSYGHVYHSKGSDKEEDFMKKIESGEIFKVLIPPPKET